MAWVIALVKRLRGIRSRLLIYYLAVMLTIIGGSIVWVYAFTRHSFYSQLDRRLETLAQSASHSLLAFKSQNADVLTSDVEPTSDVDGEVPRSQSLDDDGDLDIPWQDLRSHEQGVEWFDAEKKRVGKAGTVPQSGVFDPGDSIFSKGIRAVTLTVYAKDSLQTDPLQTDPLQTDSPQIEGYIRTSEPTSEVDALLRQFRWGLGLGGGTLLSLTGLGGIWLTRQSLKPIEKSVQQLKQFTADAAHELRSPLTTLKTSLQVMQCYPERIHPKNEQKLAAIAATTDQMIRLVEDLLLLARMDENSLAQSPLHTAIAVDRLLDELMGLMAFQAEKKHIRLQTELTTPVWVIGDERQLQRLFRNLLENAIQYTPEGGTVTVSMALSGSVVLIRVKDTGIGIAPEARSLIFNRFWRADEARDRRNNGMGMGLSIAQTIAERHRGKIGVSSQVGVGSCFQVYLPLK